LLRLLWLALFLTPGVWQMPLKVMATAAKALGGVDVFTIKRSHQLRACEHKSTLDAPNAPDIPV